MNYQELQDGIANLLNRKDLESEIIGFITLCEAMIDRDIRHWRMENRATLSTTDQYPSLPLDWVETLRLHNVDTNIPLELLSRQAMAEERARSNDAINAYGPRFYRHSQSGFELFPSPSSSEATTLELEYYAQVPRLGLDTGNGVVQTNWISDLYPDVYLYGSAIHSAPFLADDPRIQTWGQLYNNAAQRVNVSGEKAEMSASSPTFKKRGMPQSRANRNGTR